MTELELKAKEFGSQIVITDKLLNEAADKERDTIVRISLASGSRWLVVHGMKAVNWEQEMQRDPAIRGWEFIQVGEAIDGLTLLALTAKQETRLRNQADSLLAVNDLPWWKFLWLKLRGRRIVDWAGTEWAWQ